MVKFMKVKENQVFNLMDTNGRRSDVINALQGYLSILNNLSMKWGHLPKSLSQYEFYKQAIEMSPDILTKHGPYDRLQSELNMNQEFKEAIENNNLKWIQENRDKYNTLIKHFDKGIEDRARHYTSTLVKLGYADEKRDLSAIGEQLLGKKPLNRDKLENILPIDNINIIYMRQLLKLKVFNVSGKNFYSPFNMAIYILLKRERISESEFFELVQGLNPYYNFETIDDLIMNYKEGEIVQSQAISIPLNIPSNGRIKESVFKDTFKNKKSSSVIEIYWCFYNYLMDFVENSNSFNLEKLLNYYEHNNAKLKKAFGYGRNIFTTRTGTKPSVSDFIKSHKNIFKANINHYLYKEFVLSKQLDQIQEYSDTTKRIFKATGIISFDNGYVELAYKELLTHIFDIDIIKQLSYGETIFSNGHDNYFCSVKSISEIFQYSQENVENIIKRIRREFENEDIIDITALIAQKRKEEFINHINTKFPIAETKNILQLFKKRSNDSIIKDKVSSIATIPTIFEFMVGIAWYYFSGKQIDLLNSYNLTLSADFEPLVHAGGGQGDIIIYENDKVTMLEATLMNSNSQKRGEWEPVLRHSVNLKVAEESRNTDRIVTTFFIADEFDTNTINIWKAVASVPLQSSAKRENYTDNVVIMPLNLLELSKLMYKSENYDKIIKNVHDLFKNTKDTFNLDWREEFIRKII